MGTRTFRNRILQAEPPKPFGIRSVVLTSQPKWIRKRSGVDECGVYAKGPSRPAVSEYDLPVEYHILTIMWNRR